MERKEVYKAIDTEREYQDHLWNGTKSSRQPADSPNAMERTIDEFALYVARYAFKLVDVAGSTDYPKEKLEIFRKIAGLCVACGEEHGMPERRLPLKQGDEMGGSWGFSKDGKDYMVGSFDYTGGRRVAHIWLKEHFTENPAEFAKRHKLDEIIYHEKY